MTETGLSALSRQEFSRLVALISRRIGARRLDLAEDAVQDAFAAAVRTWATAEPPRDPAAWLYRAAWNRVVDHLRRREPESLASIGDVADPGPGPGEPESGDAELRLVSLCCHPSLSAESQVALTLKVAAGFSVEEIGRLLGATPEAVDQRLVRAKRSLRAAGPGALTDEPVLGARVPAILDVLYGMFVEGYASVSAASGLRRDLCFEALRLLEIMLAEPATASGPGHALAALFAFQASRLEARLDDAGSFRSLRDQDRSSWDQRLIRLGTGHLRASMGPEVSRFHLEAEIAACHALAPNYGATDWNRIVALYDLLAALPKAGPVGLNRAIAVGERDGPAVLLGELDRLGSEYADDPHVHAARADAWIRLGRRDEARRSYQLGLASARTPAARRRFEEWLSQCPADVGFRSLDPS